MRYLSLWILAALACQCAARPEGRGIQLRQENTPTTDAPNTATSGEGRPTSGPTLGQQDESTSTSRTASEPTPGSTEDGSSTGATRTAASATEPTGPTTSPPQSSTLPLSTTAPDPTAAQDDPAAATTSQTSEPVHLPIQPRITPAFGIGGVVLMLTGVAYTLIGIKHRFLQVFLSNGYLAALSVTVLIDYVMKPPISDPIQGAFFVAIFMTGCLYGGGSLIFKEVTEGFGCLLGGFCLSMWLLCLKPGGLVADQAGKAIMIGVFCVAVWSLSFSHHTRAYGLIGSTSFAGATAFVLGVDCLSRAGLKEFWFYIWALNDNLFPLNTDTYPVTRGMIVELIVIILITIIGILSQIKLWRIVRERRNRRNAVKLEDERRREVVEEAIGRHLERQNDRDRSTWEKQYGNNLNAKRSTILWTSAHPDKSVTHITPIEDKRMSSSVDSLEMLKLPNNRPHSKYSAKNMRQSTATVDAIPEEQEDGITEKRTSTERLKALASLDPAAPEDAATVSAIVTTGLEGHVERKPSDEFLTRDPPGTKEPGPEIVPLPFKVPTGNKSKDSVARSANSDSSRDSKLLQKLKRASNPGSKRASLASRLSMSPRLSIASDLPLPSESVEQLVIPSPRTSRASSVAATLDEEDRLSLADRDESAAVPSPQTPALGVSAYEQKDSSADIGLSLESDSRDRPRTPSEDSVDFEEDPEALPRPVQRVETVTQHKSASTVSGETRPQGSDSSETRITTEQSSVVDGLTPGALEQIPKQTSHVVLSYRTNEWAKHIADAEEPIFAEPDQIGEDDSEAPIRLAPVAAAVDQTKTLTTTTTSSSSTPPPPHVASADHSGITAVALEPTRSQGQTKVAFGAPAAGFGTPPTRPSLKGRRSSTLKQQNSFTVEPIDEDSVAHFPSPAGQQTPAQDSYRPKSPPAGPYRPSSSTPAASIPTVMQGAPYTGSRSSSYSSLSHHMSPQTRSQSSLGYSHDLHRISRSASMMSGVNLPVRSQTRLSNYDSRQPSSRNEIQEQQRREARLADWRLSQQHGGLINQIPQETVEHRRAQMLLDREHKRLMEDQQKASRQHEQMAMAQVMRRPEMQDAHREAMRRMQASANKNL